MKNGVVRKAAMASGVKKFIAPCEKHGHGAIHFTSSGRCMKCTAEAKDPVKQANYWKKVGHKYRVRSG